MGDIRRALSAPTFLSSGSRGLTLSLPSTSLIGACLMIFKAIVGAGLFALPYAFKLMGIGGAVIAITVVGLLTFYTGIVLVRAHEVVLRDTLRREAPYVFLAEYCFGHNVGTAVFVCIVATTLGSCGAYIVFISSVLQSIWPQFSTIFFSGITTAAILPLVLIRSQVFLVWSSMLGNVGVALVVIVTLVRGVQLANWQPRANYTVFHSDTFMQAFGIIGFVFAIPATLLVIERSMHNKRHQFGGAFLLTTWLVIAGCTAFGLANYLFFGEAVCDVVVRNLSDGPLATTAKLAIAADLALTFPITLAAGREALEKSLLNEASSWLAAKRNVIAIVMLAASYAITFFPSFGTIINIVGGWSVSILCFILPPMMLLQLRRFHLTAFHRHVLSKEHAPSQGSARVSSAASTHIATRATPPADNHSPLGGPHHIDHPISFHPWSALQRQRRHSQVSPSLPSEPSHSALEKKLQQRVDYSSKTEKATHNSSTNVSSAGATAQPVTASASSQHQEAAVAPWHRSFFGSIATSSTRIHVSLPLMMPVFRLKHHLRSERRTTQHDAPPHQQPQPPQLPLTQQQQQRQFDLLTGSKRGRSLTDVCALPHVTPEIALESAESSKSNGARKSMDTKSVPPQNDKNSMLLRGLTDTFNLWADRPAVRRHHAALQLLGVGSAAESIFLVAVALFGAATLVLTTLQSIQSAVVSNGGGSTCGA